MVTASFQSFICHHTFWTWLDADLGCIRTTILKAVCSVRHIQLILVGFLSVHLEGVKCFNRLNPVRLMPYREPAKIWAHAREFHL